MSDGLREYLNLVTGITETTATRAMSVAAELLNSGIEWGTKGHTTVTELADDLVTTGRDNREALIALIRSETERTAARMGFVTEDEVAALRRKVNELEAQLVALQPQSRTGKATSKKKSEKKRPEKKRPEKKNVKQKAAK